MGDGSYSFQERCDVKTLEVFSITADVPQISADHPRIDRTLADMVAAYLAHGRLILISQVALPDFLSPNLEERVSTSAATDGEWIWGLWVEYYVREYQLNPGDDFLRYLKDRNYVINDVSDEAAERARAFYLA